MSLESIQGKLSRVEMKNIMAGSKDGYPCDHTCSTASDCGSNCQHCTGGYCRQY